MRLTRKGFRAWLESKRPREIVGEPAETDMCPLANFIGKEWNYEGPKWADDFANSVDDLLGQVQRITAARALKILDKTP